MSLLTLENDLKYQNHLSNAVLTPHLINPKYWATANPNTCRSDYAVKPMPLRPKEIQARKRWCEVQMIALENNPSNAVLYLVENDT